MNIRYPIVAGHFYPLNPEQLRANLDKYMLHAQKKIENVYGIIVPHAGYIYSGKTAGKVYSSIETPDLAIIFCPNHTGLGKPISLHPAEQWVTPLGIVDVDKDFLSKLFDIMPEAAWDSDSQLREHSLEVQIPFLQYINPKIKIAPITLSFLPTELVCKLAKAISKIIDEKNKNTKIKILLVASSDMTHFETIENAKQNDDLVISLIKKLDTQTLINTVTEQDISMCGIMPVAVILEAIKDKDITVDLIDYSTSADVSGDTKNVVAYAGMVLYKKSKKDKE